MSESRNRYLSQDEAAVAVNVLQSQATILRATCARLGKQCLALPKLSGSEDLIGDLAQLENHIAALHQQLADVPGYAAPAQTPVRPVTPKEKRPGNITAACCAAHGCANETELRIKLAMQGGPRIVQPAHDKPEAVGMTAEVCKALGVSHPDGIATKRESEGMAR
jgi:hypothetical protein